MTRSTMSKCLRKCCRHECFSEPQCADAMTQKRFCACADNVYDAAMPFGGYKVCSWHLLSSIAAQSCARLNKVRHTFST